MFIWIAVAITITLILIIFYAKFTPDSDQMPLQVVPEMIIITAGGLLIIIIATAIFNISWVKKNWFISLIIVGICFELFYQRYKSVIHPLRYATADEVILNNGKSYLKKTEFYDNEGQRVRSVAFYYNNKRDSIWTTYSGQGQILRQSVYRNDSLISIIK